MTAPSMAEVLHEAHCGCDHPDDGCIIGGHDHLGAQALAAAGFGHVASVERERDELVSHYAAEATRSLYERKAAEQEREHFQKSANDNYSELRVARRRAEAAEQERDAFFGKAMEYKRIAIENAQRAQAAEAQVAAARALLDGAPMVPQAMVRRALDGEGGR